MNVGWLEDVAEDGVKLREELVTKGELGAVWRPLRLVTAVGSMAAIDVLILEAIEVEERSTGVLSLKVMPSGPALFGDLLWDALPPPPASTKCLFRMGKHSRGSSFGDFGTLTSA